jgi:hypothetical protein
MEATQEHIMDLSGLNPCGNCKQAGAVHICARCRGAWYCGRECQKKAWKLHKQKCHPHAVAAETLAAMEARLATAVASVEAAVTNRGALVLQAAVAADRGDDAAGGALDDTACASYFEDGAKAFYCDKAAAAMGEAVFKLCNTFDSVDEAALLALLQRGAHTDHRDAVFNSPLSVCCINGSIGAMRLLLAAGADVAAQDSDGITPLRLADDGPHTLAARLLRKHKAPYFADLRYVGPGMESSRADKEASAAAGADEEDGDEVSSEED